MKSTDFNTSDVATPGPASLSSMVDLLVQAGSLLLQHGADAGRVEASLEQMEPGLGIERIDAVVMSKTILLTATRRDAHHTRVARVPIIGVNMNVLSEVEQLLGRFQQGQVTAGQLALELDRIARLPHHYSRGVIVAATGLACAAFCRLFGGDWAAMAIKRAEVCLALLRADRRVGLRAAHRPNERRRHVAVSGILFAVAPAIPLVPGSRN